MVAVGPFHIETACCSVEFGAASGPRYDVERFGIIEAFGSLRQCDLVVVQGTITRKMAPRLRLVYDQMPEPKYVIAMGACAITGGLYFDSYNVLPGIDGVLPVDVYVPGCPPRPETLIQGCMLLQEKNQEDEGQEVRLAGGRGRPRTCARTRRTRRAHQEVRLAGGAAAPRAPGMPPSGARPPRRP